jgi:hypothetical protein
MIKPKQKRQRPKPYIKPTVKEDFLPWRSLLYGPTDEELKKENEEFNELMNRYVFDTNKKAEQLTDKNQNETV